MAISNYNTDPDLNVDISGINIAEGCPPSGINNAIRQMMADVKTFTDSPTFSGGLTVSSGATISGGATADTLTVTSGAAISGGATVTSGVTADTLTVTSGATISGGMTVDGKGLVFDSGDQTISGTKTFSSTIVCRTGSPSIRRNVRNDAFRIYGGDADLYGATLSLAGGTNSAIAGFFRLYAAKDGSNYKLLDGSPSGTLKWNGQTIQTSSDERLKTAFSEVPDAVLDAWGAVNWQQFKFKEAVAEKGEENCRWHNGLVAQRVKAVFEELGLDACEYGILCYDVWEDEYYEEDGVQKLERPAGDLWTVRYEEALAMEAAYQRRRADRAEARISALEQRLAELEQAIAALAGGAE